MKRNVNISKPAITPIVDKVRMIGYDEPEIVTIAPEDYNHPEGIMRVSLLKSPRIRDQDAVGILNDIIYEKNINPLNLDLNPHKYSHDEYIRRMNEEFAIPSTVRNLFKECQLDYITNHNQDDYLGNSQVMDCCEFYGAATDTTPFGILEGVEGDAFAVFDVRAIGNSSRIPYFLEKCYMKSGEIKFALFMDAKFVLVKNEPNEIPLAQFVSFDKFFIFNLTKNSPFNKIGKIFEEYNETQN